MSANGYASVRSDGSHQAGEALTAFQAVYRKDSDGKIYSTDDSSSNQPIGVAFDDYAADDECVVIIAGRGKILVDGSGTTIDPWDLLEPGDGGKCVKHTGDTGDYFIAVALEASSADGDIIDCLLLDHKTAAA